jgi:hypothetical protein
VLLQDQSTQSNKSLDSLRGRHDRVKAEAKRIASENFVLIDQYRSIRSDLDNLEMRTTCIQDKRRGDRARALRSVWQIL